jgi:DNA modification methylase
MKPYYQDEYVTILLGSCLDTVLKGITGIVTDPPYELSFMGKKWDGTGISFQQDTWKILRECCKPGAMLLSFGGDRTHHRMMVAIEDAGWDIRTCVYWVFGSGFPKSLDISKAIDKQAGVEREVIGKYRIPNDSDAGNAGKVVRSVTQDGGCFSATAGKEGTSITKPATTEGQLWDGYGTALKPAVEIICVAMNPLDGTFANNALKHGVAGLNIDECRVSMGKEDESNRQSRNGKSMAKLTIFGNDSGEINFAEVINPQGRFPANLIHDGSEEVIELFPQSDVSGSAKNGRPATRGNYSKPENIFGGSIGKNQGALHNDSGSASRFFYCAKASKSERGNDNHHPTVKPLALMEYLVKLISPPKDALLLDPFMGSGTTLLACKQLGIKCIGIELDESSCEIAAKRCIQESFDFDITTQSTEKQVELSI